MGAQRGIGRQAPTPQEMSPQTSERGPCGVLPGQLRAQGPWGGGPPRPAASPEPLLSETQRTTQQHPFPLFLFLDLDPGVWPRAIMGQRCPVPSAAILLAWEP